MIDIFRDLGIPQISGGGFNPEEWEVKMVSGSKSATTGEQEIFSINGEGYLLGFYGQEFIGTGGFYGTFNAKLDGTIQVSLTSSNKSGGFLITYPQYVFLCNLANTNSVIKTPFVQAPEQNLTATSQIKWAEGSAPYNFSKPNSSLLDVRFFNESPLKFETSFQSTYLFTTSFTAQSKALLLLKK